MQSLLILLDQLIWIYTLILIGAVVCSWLIAFNVINTRNQFVHSVVSILYRLTEPVLAPIRRFLPDLGGIDISPVILILLLGFVRMLLTNEIPRWLGLY